MGKILQLELRQKLQAISDYTSEPFTSDEALELNAIISDTEAPLDDRILCANIMRSIAETRLQRAKNQVSHWTGIHSQLVHDKEFGKHTDATLKMLEKFGSPEEIMQLMQAALNRKEDSK